MNIVLNREKRNNIFILIVCLMALSGVVSSAVVLLDSDRLSCYYLLWLLPVSFSLNCFVIYGFRKLLFTRISITMITGFYWIRMVVTPIFMVLGNYAVVPENTSWQAYLNEAIILECYESFVMFALLLLWSKHLLCENRNPFRQSSGKKLRYSDLFILAFGLVCAFFFGMILRWPVLIRYQFIPIWGAPQGWAVPVVEQRSLSGSGSGPLGILVTLFCYLILVMQIILPAVILTWILNRGYPGTSMKKIFCVLLLISAVFIIATESRGNSVYSALALFLTLMSYSDERQLRREALVVSLIVCCAVFMLWIKQGHSASDENSIFHGLSTMFTAYFSGPQNTAAAIQATKESFGPNPLRIWPDIVQHVPFVGTIWRRIVGTSVSPGCSAPFNQTLYGMSGMTDQLLSPIGEGYMHFGFFLAPMVPAVTARLALWMEERARKTDFPPFKNICYVGTMFMACAQVSFALGQAMSYLWYIGLAALITLPISAKWRPENGYPSPGTGAS